MKPDDRDGDEPEPGEGPPPFDVPSEQPADDPRGADEVRRELGPGDGDDPPPAEDDDPLDR